MVSLDSSIDSSVIVEQVRKFNRLPPFNFPEIYVQMLPTVQNYSKYITQHYMSEYAVHLYDSVMLYAKV